MSSPLLVAAIDFGTTYSGWAYSFRHDFDRDPTQISARNWTGAPLVSSKVSTCILINPDGKTFNSFGFEAETKYAELATEKQHKSWFFFKTFKMMLFDKMKIQRKATLEDETGKQLPAKLVFSLAIKFLKDDLLEECDKKIADVLKEEDIQWVLTVPAIWNDAAKQFMREAAEDAGIQKSKLKIALEPEAASLYCRYLPIQKGKENLSLSSFKPGTKYIVLDAGGGTIDITVHQVIVDGKLRELHKASGGAWGGTMVDKAYKEFIESIAGSEAVRKFKEDHKEDYIDFLRSFEVKKREIPLPKRDKVTFRIPASLAKTINEVSGNTLEEMIAVSKFQEVSYVSEKLRVDQDIARAFFKHPVDCIIQQLSSMLKEKSTEDCAAILMVGGFSESKLLQDAILREFGEKMKIIVPGQAGLAVLKGAVIFGHSPKIISERICKYTYGVRGSHKTSERCTHPPTEMKEIDGIMHCRNLFAKHVTVGQIVRQEEEQPELITAPSSCTQKSICVGVNASTSRDPILVSEQGCVKVGEFVISIPDSTLGKQRKFGIRFIFGDTEIAVKVEDKMTGEVHIEAVDCLDCLD